MKRRKKYIRAVFPLLLIVLTFSFAMFQGGFLSWFLFYTFLPFGLYVLCLIFYPFSTFTVERSLMKREYKAGDIVQVQVQLSRKNRFPLLYIILEDEMSPILSRKAKAAAFVGFSQTIEYMYSMEDIERGEYRFQQIRLFSSDLLGLYHKEHVLPLEESILVYPKYYDLPQRHLEYLLSGEDGVNVNYRRENTVVSGVRDYEIGDPLSRIHWKASAKANTLMTKEFEGQKRDQLYVIVDQEGKGEFERMITFAASFIHSALQNGTELGFVTIDEMRDFQQGDMYRQHIFYDLARLQAHSFASLETTFKKLAQKKVHIVLMTASLTFEKLEVMAGHRNNRVVTCFVVQSWLTEEDKIMKDAAAKRGIRVRFIKESEGGLYEELS